MHALFSSKFTFKIRKRKFFSMLFEANSYGQAFGIFLWLSGLKLFAPC